MLGMLLDDCFFSDFHLQEVDNPLFIIGNARSGTTLCHRLLANYDDQFTSMQLWEILFGVSVTWRLLFYMLYDLDQCYLSGFINYLIRILDKQTLGRLPAHPFSLFEMEEDEWLMMHIFSSQLVLLFFPCGLSVYKCLSTMPCLPNFEQDLTIKQQDYILLYYKSCIQRHLYARRLLRHIKNNSFVSFSPTLHTIPTLYYISKNPTFTVRLNALSRTFPSAKFACMIRDPVEAVPSMVAYIAMVCSATCLLYRV